MKLHTKEDFTSLLMHDYMSSREDLLEPTTSYMALKIFAFISILYSLPFNSFSPNSTLSISV